MRSTPRIDRLEVSAYVVPTDRPETDGTLAWDHTTMVLVEACAAATRGLGYSYADLATARLVRDVLAPLVTGRDALAPAAASHAMSCAVRNLGRAGVAAMAISAVDAALWDLKARLLDVSLVDLLGAVRQSVPVYGSGGFTSYSVAELERQLGDWAAAGIRRVKMKVGRDAAADPARVRAARGAIGDAALFVDANGAYRAKQALALAAAFADSGVTWLEEPVSSDDLAGLRFIRGRVPAPIDVAAGEYGYGLFYFRRMLAAGAVDVLQADATRCGGVSGFLAAGTLCDAFAIPLSAHCAPSLHAHLGCALTRVCHLEYFHDHARLEHLLLDGALDPTEGELRPDRSRPGLGLELKHADAARYAA